MSTMQPVAETPTKRPRRGWRLGAEVLLWRWGVAGLLGAMLWASAAALAAWQLRPLQLRLEAARAVLRDPPVNREAPPAATLLSDHTSPVADLRAALPAEESLDAQVQNLIQLAGAHRIELPTIDYATQRETATGLVRKTLSAPVRADYVAVREFAEALLRTMPNASLDRITFRRDNVNQPQVLAQLQISLWARGAVRPAPTGLAQ
jgi:hypothetical protein